MVRLFFFYLLVLSLQLHAIEPKLFLKLDKDTFTQVENVTGVLEITHDDSDVIDVSSFTLNNKSINLTLIKNLRFSPNDPLTISFYRFELPSYPVGEHSLGPFFIKIGDKSFKIPSIPLEVVKISRYTTVENKQVELKISSEVQSPQPIYPGQHLFFNYTYIYKGDIQLTKEDLPLFELLDFTPIGQKQAFESKQGDLSILKVTQEVKAKTPGTYAVLPAKIEGKVLEKNLNQRVVAQTSLYAESEPTTIVVSPFPEANKPYFFNGSIGKDLQFNVELINSPVVKVGNTLQLAIRIKGDSESLNDVVFPKVCCQIGFSGFFEQDKIPNQTIIQEGIKTFFIDLKLISNLAKEIPAISFAYFDTNKQTYVELKSEPIPLNVLQEKQTDISITDDSALQFHSVSNLLPFPQFQVQWYDLNQRLFANWWSILLLPACLLVWFWQKKERAVWINQQKALKNSAEYLFQSTLKLETTNPLFYNQLYKSFLQLLYEKKEIDNPFYSFENLENVGLPGMVKQFLVKVDEFRFSKNHLTDIPSLKQEAEQLFYLVKQGKGVK